MAGNRGGLKGFFVALTILGVLLGAVGLHFLVFYYRPVPETKIVAIQKKWNLQKAARALEMEGVIFSAFWMRVLAKATGHTVVQAGEYRFEQGRLPKAILGQLQSGMGVLEYRFVVPEGLSAKEIGLLMAKQGWSDVEGLLFGSQFLQQMNLDSASVEGWLFPDTYFYRGGDSAADVARRMVERGRRVLAQEWEGRPKAFAMTAYQALILASIVEKETGQGTERPLIAGVFHNRIKRDMMLQSDPTVIYGIADFDGNLTRKHLNTPTPYNTYARKGLPPTPICNPGQAAIHAVFHPESTKALYFVANGNGAHIFSSTLEEHEKNVDIYQRHSKPRP
ncbi:MAG TPA: endolytic transglycosylase MltG [Magnetococcales bacterium]|nr:endolytic transglycosylase MltG [Magnetococcales bacterium]